MTTIIGVDCAAQDCNTGLALGHFDGHQCKVSKVVHGNSVDTVAGTISEWIPENQPTLIAMDAPLGWPAPLGECLHSHKAGEHVAIESDMLFSRITDKIVWKKTRKKPLEIGADKIARAARSALNLLNNLRALTGDPVPLLTTKPIMDGRICAIEVYPAATLTVKGFMQPKYKDKKELQTRRSILNSLDSQLNITADRNLIENSHDVLDAVICVLAGMDFLLRDVIIPSKDDFEYARKEGWIWVADPGD
jgi:hypothetical protein